MSVAFVQRGRPPPTPAQIQTMLNENSQLIQTIQEYQNKGKVSECVQYQQTLHRNLVYLASIADSTQNISALLPPPASSPSPVPAGVPNSPVPPPPSGQLAGTPLNEITNQVSQLPQPSPSHFQQPQGSYRPPLQPQPQQAAGPPRPPVSNSTTPQQYRPSMQVYPQQSVHSGFQNSQYPPNQGPMQPSYNPPPVSNAPSSVYQQQPASYPPMGPGSYPQQPSTGYGPPPSSSSTNTGSYGPPPQNQPVYANTPGYPPASQQPGYGGGYGQSYVPNQPLPPGPQMPYGSGYPGYGTQQGGYPPVSAQNPVQGPPPPSQGALPPPSQGAFSLSGSVTYPNNVAPQNPPSSYPQTTASPSTSTQTYSPGSASQNYPPVSQPGLLVSSYPHSAPNPQAMPQPGGYGPPPPQPPPHPGTQIYPPPPNQGQAPQGYPPQAYSQQGYGPQPYPPVPGQPMYQQYQRPPGPQPPPNSTQPSQYPAYNYQPSPQ